MNARALAMIFLAGCATPATDYNAAKESWHGVRYETIVSQWGAPTHSTLRTGGGDDHTWVSESVSGGTWYPSFSVFGGSRGVGAGTGVVLGQTGGERVHCERTLYFRDGRVVGQSWHGQSKYCNTFRRN